ncbi:MAG TPA: ABC transporter ATP-binding protein [Blastocatellia bacterium]|nr:ABC transporter ATP-binding protein [Blastocatellia bacterium]
MPAQTPAHAAQDHSITPFQRLRQLLWLDRYDLFIIAIYTLLIGTLFLAVPLAAQALVNTIAAGVMLQPLVVLTFAVLGALIFAGIFRLLKLALLEKLQQRIFARVALQLADQLPRIQHNVMSREYAPHLVNRFFDVVTLQKTMSKLLFDGPAASLQVLMGLVVLAFYSPYFLAFDLFIIVVAAFIVLVMGMGGLPSSIKESYAKYRIADWLEELARCQRGFKMNAVPAFPIQRADDLVVEYVAARRRHFRVVFRQALGNALFRAVASAGVLAIGGWLVINRQLTLGQVVAAEILVVGVLEGLDKLIRLLESGYDLLTSLDKIGHLTDLPVERQKGHDLPLLPDGARVTCRKVHFAYEHQSEILCGLDLQLEPGVHVSLVGESGVGKSTLAALLCGLLEPAQGLVQINGVDVRDVQLESLRRVVGLVSDTNEIFAGTIEENILLGRSYITHEDLQWALEFTHLTDELAKFPQGLQTRLITEGRNLSRGQVQRLLIARAIVSHPSLLILDEGFTGIDEKDKLQILDELYSPKYGWTIIDISHDPEVVLRAQIVHVLAKGKIVESGKPAELMRQRNCEFRTLFPSLGLRGLR